MGLMIVSFEKVDSLQSGLTREIIKGETNQYRARANHFGTKYTETITFKISLMHKDYSPMSKGRIMYLNKWLTSPKYPKELCVVGCNGEEYKYRGLFTEVSYEYSAEGVIAINYTFVNDSPFMYRTYSENFTLTKEKMWETMDIYCYSDCAYDYTYPTIKLTYTRTNQSDTEDTENAVTWSNWSTEEQTGNEITWSKWSSEDETTNEVEWNNWNEENTISTVSSDADSNEETIENKLHVHIANIYDDHKITFVDIPLTEGDTVVIDCKNQILTDEKNTVSMDALIDWGNENDGQISWIKFINGKNNMNFGFQNEDVVDEYDVVKVEVIWEELQKVGELFEY